MLYALNLHITVQKLRKLKYANFSNLKMEEIYGENLKQVSESAQKMEQDTINHIQFFLENKFIKI